MSIQFVNVGQTDNDGTGDDLREAFVKVNENFTKLALLVTESTTVSNVGSGVGLYAGNQGYNLQFKTLVKGNGINIVPSANTITISVDQIVKSLALSADTGEKMLSGADSLSIVGESSITTTITGNTLTIKSDFNNLSDDPTPVLGANLNAENFSISNLQSINGASLEGLHKVVGNNFDFGTIRVEASNIIDWITINATVSMGTFAQPSAISVNMGSL
jgi:hypothetical protein